MPCPRRCEQSLAAPSAASPVRLEGVTLRRNACSQSGASPVRLEGVTLRRNACSQLGASPARLEGVALRRNACSQSGASPARLERCAVRRIVERWRKPTHGTLPACFERNEAAYAPRFGSTADASTLRLTAQHSTHDWSQLSPWVASDELSARSTQALRFRARQVPGRSVRVAGCGEGCLGLRETVSRGGVGSTRSRSRSPSFTGTGPGSGSGSGAGSRLPAEAQRGASPSGGRLDEPCAVSRTRTPARARTRERRRTRTRTRAPYPSPRHRSRKPEARDTLSRSPKPEARTAKRCLRQATAKICDPS